MRQSLVYFVLGTSLFAGCGDDGGTNTPPDAPRAVDARDIDAPPPTPDGPTFKGYDANEGGEVRMEYIVFPNTNTGTRTTAFFYKDPGPTDFYEYLNLDGCTDMRDLTKWPMATNPIADRDYYDVGPYIVATGGTAPLNIPKRVAGADPFARSHPDQQWYFDPIASTDTDGGILTPSTLYDITLPGSTEFPGSFFEDVIYMPASFALTNHPHSTPLVTAADTAMTFTWEVNDTNVPAGTEVLGLVAFTGSGGPVVICVEPNNGGSDGVAGSITVPAPMMNIVRAAIQGTPSRGTMLARQTLTHTVREMVDDNGPTGRRIDFLGVWCYANTPVTAP